jgi:hypothetical protein
MGQATSATFSLRSVRVNGRRRSAALPAGMPGHHYADELFHGPIRLLNFSSMSNSVKQAAEYGEKTDG